MAWLISVLGAALALAGAVSLVNGVAYVRLDWGATETVAGTVALSGGLVVLALGAVLFALRDLLRRPARPASAGVGLEALTDRDEAPAPQPAFSRFKSKLATVGMPRTELPEPMADLPSAGTGSDRAEPPVEPSGFAPALRPSFPTEPEPAAEPSPARRDPASVPEASYPPPPTDAAPTVVGRYQANGASYVLFSDGTIEVETEGGTHRFASMADLREHIQRQEAG